MRDGGAIHHGLVISKHVGLPPDGNAKVAQSGLQVDGLVHTDPGSYELRPIGSTRKNISNNNQPTANRVLVVMGDS